MIVDLMDAAQTAVFGAISGRQALTNLSQVTQHVLPNMLAAGHITRIGKIESGPIGEKSDQLEEISIDIETLYRGTSRAEVLAIMFQQRLALDGQALAHDGVAFDTPEWAGAVVDGPAKDGVTYVGIQTFTIIAEPA